jgi:hypothetical protein
MELLDIQKDMRFPRVPSRNRLAIFVLLGFGQFDCKCQKAPEEANIGDCEGEG